MSRRRAIHVWLSLLSITLVIAQVLGASMAAAAAGSPGREAKAAVVICSAHGPMTVEMDAPAGSAPKSLAHNCPCCLAGCAGAPKAPLASVVAYELKPEASAGAAFEPAADHVTRPIVPRGPAVPRGPPHDA